MTHYPLSFSATNDKKIGWQGDVGDKAKVHHL